MVKNIRIQKYEKIDNFILQVKGLMFSKKVNIPLVFIFKKDMNSSFHSFFCPNFDIIFLDKEKRVVDYKEVNSWQLIIPNKNYRYVIETPSGFIKKKKIVKGIKIEFK